MDIRDLPFAKLVGIKKKENDLLILEPTAMVQNHIESIHAAALFTLAETQSGFYLQSLFPEYKGKVLPLLRGSSVKYKHPATKEIYAVATVDNHIKDKFEARFLKKGRASISISVELRDSDGMVSMTGEFNWFVQRIQ